MYDRPKGNYSYLIGFAKQLQDAVASHRDDDVGNYCESLAHSLALLLQHVGYVLGDEPAGDDEGVDPDDTDGDGPELGGPVQPDDADGRAAAVDLTSVGARRAVGAALAKRGFRMGAGREQQLPPILTRPKTRKRARRGKK